jgi:hypothetical protein
MAIFIHFCEMFICVRPSGSLFWLFHMLSWSQKGSGLIDAYYFQLQAKGPITYITPISPGKWDRWRDDWVIIQTNVHDCLVLQTESPTAKRSD